MKKNKKAIYIIAAVILIIAGLWLKRQPSGEEAGSNQVANVASDEQQDVEVKESQSEQSSEDAVAETLPEDYVEYYFRNDNLLEQHYEKHGVEMGFDSMEEYEEAACAVIYNPDALTKTEKEDGDYVYYVEETNEFVILSPDGYIRTYFNPSAGIDYYNRQ